MRVGRFTMRLSIELGRLAGGCEPKSKHTDFPEESHCVHVVAKTSKRIKYRPLQMTKLDSPWWEKKKLKLKKNHHRE